MRNRFWKNSEGQIMIWLALGLGLLILFTAMAVDMGLIYMTKARLSNAVDSAVLTAAKNFNGSGTTTLAQGYGNDMFAANFGASCTSLPTCNWTWHTAAGSPISATLNATTHVNTTFMSYLPQWAQWTVGDTGAATRSTLVMSIVLDRSGSMCTVESSGKNKCPTGVNGDAGGDALQAAVPLFIANFVPGTDYLGLLSFASNATVDVPISTAWGPANSGSIYTAVQNLAFTGGTFGTGAGTNSYSYSTNSNGPPLSMADYENNTISLPAGQPETKVVVYFTDGLMNTVQDLLLCTNLNSGKGVLYNYGGYDATNGNYADFLDPATGNDLSTSYANDTTQRSGTGGGCTAGANNGYGMCNGYPPYNASHSCFGVYSFYSQRTQTNINFALDNNGNMDRADITAEAQWRAIYTAGQMGMESPVPTYIFVIGLGNAVSGSLSTEQFLTTLANDKDAATTYGCLTTCYTASRPEGLFVVVPGCPSPTCTTELEAAFNLIASKVLLRLSQ